MSLFRGDPAVSCAHALHYGQLLSTVSSIKGRVGVGLLGLGETGFGLRSPNPFRLSLSLQEGLDQLIGAARRGLGLLVVLLHDEPNHTPTVGLAVVEPVDIE